MPPDLIHKIPPYGRNDNHHQYECREYKGGETALIFPHTKK
jgi:hypothetical protein